MQAAVLRAGAPWHAWQRIPHLPSPAGQSRSLTCRALPSCPPCPSRSAGPGHPVWEYGSIYRMARDGSNIQLVARGVRNTVGFDWHPVTGKVSGSWQAHGKPTG